MYSNFSAYDGTGGGLMQRTPLLIKDLVKRGPSLQPEEEIWTRIENGYHRITWREHERNCFRLASALHKYGVKHADRIGTFEFNTARHMQLYQAIPCLGAILHPINLRLHPKELAFIINDAKDKLIFVGADLLPIIEKVENLFPAEFSCVEMVVVMGKNELPGGWSTRLKVKTADYEAFISTGDAYFEYPDFDENSALALCYTSGTTGKPKGVLYSHRSTYIHTLVICLGDTFNFSATDCVLAVVPQFHVLSWGYPYMAMMLGIRYCQINKYSAPMELLQFFIDAEVTKSSGVPTIWNEIRLELQANKEKYVGKLKLKDLVCGGSAPASEMMVWYWQNWGIEIVQAWGMTETNPIGVVSKRLAKRKHLLETDEERAAHVRKTGILVPGLDIKIVDPDNFNKELPHDGLASGELLIKGPWIAGAYLHNRGKDKFHNGYLATGDIASIDPENYMVIRDRSKDLIKSGGEWISSVDMENMVKAIDGVIDACVIGVPHPKWTERPIVIIVSKKSVKHDRADWLERVRKHLSTKFAKFQLPDDVLFWDAIPETSTRKKDKKTVRAMLKKQNYLLPSLSKL